VKNALIWIAVVLVIVWVLARITLAVTSLALHLLWIGAVVMAIVWVVGKLSAKSG
jgi:hypothetical protein